MEGGKGDTRRRRRWSYVDGAGEKGFESKMVAAQFIGILAQSKAVVGIT